MSNTQNPRSRRDGVTPGQRLEHAQHVSSLKIYFLSRLIAVASRILKSLISLAAFHMLTTSYCTYNMSSLKDRRIEQCNKLFELVVSDSAHKLHYLLPPKNVYVSRYNLLETSVNLRNLRCAPSFFPIPLSNLCLSGRTLARSFIETFYGGHL